MSEAAHKDVVVVFSPVGGGHRSAALAIAEAARRRGLTVETINAFDHAPRWAGDAYLTAHLTGQNAVPELYGRMYESANRRGTFTGRGGPFDPIRHELDNILFGSLADRVASLSPRVVIATHHLPLVVLGRARRSRGGERPQLEAPLVGIVTDYTSHACWAEEGVDLWAVACNEARRELETHGASPHRIVTTGIPVRSAFEAVPDLTPPAPNEPLRVLVTSGGFGASSIATIVESFSGVAHVELTIVCGNAPKIELRAARAARALGVRARVIGFERDMPARMAEAHVVVGKAGGLTVTETMTAGRPMVIASAVPGNEKVNEARVVRANAGVVSDPKDVGLVVDALRGKEILTAMARSARALVPRGAADKAVARALASAAQDARAAAPVSERRARVSIDPPLRRSPRTSSS